MNKPQRRMVSEAKVEEARVESPPQKFYVTCRCPTPLQFTELEVEALSVNDAVQQFFAKNGISGTDHDIQVDILG